MAHAHSHAPTTIVESTHSATSQHPFGVANDSTPDRVVRAAQVTISWGDSVLSVMHLSRVRAVTLGESGPAGTPCDFLIPMEALGFSYWPLLRVDAVCTELCIPHTATGTLMDDRGHLVQIEKIRGELRRDPSGMDARLVELRHGMRAHLQIANFCVDVAAIEPVEAMKRHVGDGVDRPLLAAFASSLFSVGGLLGALAYFIPPMGLMDEDAMSEDQVRVIQQYLLSSAEREREATESQAAPGPEPGERAGESGHRSPGAEGKTGSLTSTNPRGRIGMAGPANNTDIRLAREKARIEASTFGIIELLGTMNSATQGAVASPWGAANPLGRDPTNAEGQMWGDAIGESAGFGGLSLSGTGEGGGCRGPGCGAGIGIDQVGTIGGGLGTCDPNKGPCGFGRSGGGGTLGSHKTRVPRLRVPNTIVSGRLPPEVIQRVVRQNFGRFRFCYEQGLTRNPNLAGRVGIRFVIGRDGAVSNVADGGSNLPDAAVQSCVLSSFYNLSFPAPEGGIVTVTYPIQFEPG